MRLAALLGEPRGDVGVERRQVVEARQPEPLEELEAGAVQDRPAGRVRAAELHDEPPVEQAPDRVVRVDAADPLDGGLRHGLAVGDDRQRLERRPATAGPRPRRRSGRRARRPRARSRARPGRPDEQPDAASRSATSRSPSRSSTVAASTPASAAISRRRQRPLGDEQQRLEGGLGELDRRRGVGRVGRRRRGCGGRRRRPRPRARRDRSSSSLTRTTPATRRAARRSTSARDARRRLAPRRWCAGRRSAPTARPARRRSRAAS